MRIAKLYAGPVDGVPIAALPVGLVAFGKDGKPRVRFVDTEPLAEGWESVVTYAQEAGVMGPDILNRWAEGLANGITMDIEIAEQEVEDEDRAFEDAWAQLWEEYIETQLDLAEIEDMVNRQQIYEERLEDQRRHEEAIVALMAELRR
ncbi:MAG: hypothetical protein DIU69_13555 [Bacillota bacterium]|nr:MAG: hypothetical protein DIU69_13555 [Bacillota bacterium]